jgi:hypothetical protein
MQNLNKNTQTNTPAQGAKMTQTVTKVANIAQFIQSFKSNYDLRFSNEAMENVCLYMMSFYGDGPDSLKYFEKWGHEPMTLDEAIFGLYAITKKDLELGEIPYVLKYHEVDTFDRENIRDAVLQARGVEATENLVCVKQIRKFMELKECPTFMKEWCACESGAAASTYVDSRVGPPVHFNFFNTQIQALEA